MSDPCQCGTEAARLLQAEITALRKELTSVISLTFDIASRNNGLLTGENILLERAKRVLGGSPKVEPPPRRNGATLACGCWTYGVMPGQRQGRDSVDCDVHGSQIIEKTNVEEPV